MGSNFISGEYRVKMRKMTMMIVIVQPVVHPFSDRTIFVDLIFRNFIKQITETVGLFRIHTGTVHTIQQIGEQLFHDCEIHCGIFHCGTRMTGPGCNSKMSKVAGRIFRRYRRIQMQYGTVPDSIIPIKQGGFIHKGENFLTEKFFIAGIKIIIPEMTAKPSGTADPVDNDAYCHTGTCYIG